MNLFYILFIYVACLICKMIEIVLFYSIYFVVDDKENFLAEFGSFKT